MKWMKNRQGKKEGRELLGREKAVPVVETEKNGITVGQHKWKREMLSGKRNL